MLIQDLINYYSRNSGNVLKEYLYQLLEDRAGKHYDIIERLASSFVTQKEVEELTRMAFDLYELGFLRSTREHEKLMQQLGYRVNVVPPNQNSDSGS